MATRKKKSDSTTLETRIVKESHLTITYDANNYVVDTFLKPGRLSLGYGKTWPTLYGNINDVTITYTAGYGTEPSGVPMQIRQAVLMMIADGYDNREDYKLHTLTR